MTKYTRIAWAVACATLLATPALGLGASATIRVEGATSTLLSERSANIPTDGTATLVDSFDGDVATSSNQSGTSLLGRALLDGGLPVGFTNYGPGLGVLITRIGPDAAPAIWFLNAPYWKLKVNHALSSVGASSLVMRPGDQVLWAFGDGTENELDVVGPSAPQVVGAPFTVHVDKYDDGQNVPGAYGPDYPDYTGQANPPVAGSGVTVTYGSQSVTTDANGNATLITDVGLGNVVATATNAIRDSARTCGYPADRPEVCDLAPLVLTLPDVTVRVTVTLPSGRVVVANLAVPTRGSKPVSINPNDVDAPGATRRERRLAAGKLASALVFQINARADGGDAAVTPPSGTRWRAVWLRGAATAAPLGPREKLLGMRHSTTAATKIMRGITQGAADALRACNIKGHALTVQRFSYAMAVVTSPGVGTRGCINAAAR